MEIDKSFKEVLAKDNEIVCEPCVIPELTYEQLNEWLASLKCNSQPSISATASKAAWDCEDAFWSEFDSVLFNLVKDLKEYYFFDGFMDDMTYANLLKVFKKNIKVEKAQNADDDDNLSNPEDDEIIF